jgi:hypothetical protein
VIFVSGDDADAKGSRRASSRDERRSHPPSTTSNATRLRRTSTAGARSRSPEIRATGESSTIAHHLYTEDGDRKILIASLRSPDTFTKIDGAFAAPI